MLRPPSRKLRRASRNPVVRSLPYRVKLPLLPSLPVMAVKTAIEGLEGELILIAQDVGRLFEQEKKGGHDYASPQPG